MDDLALQVGQRHLIVIDDAERADAGGGEIEQHRAAQAAGADDQNLGVLQLALAGPTHFLQHDVPGIAFKFLGRKLHQPCPVEPKPPVPRWVSERLAASASRTCVTGATIIWAMRSPRLMAKAST